MTVVGYVHGLPDGRIDNDSVLVIDGTTYPIPERTENAGRLAPARICAALKDAGYEPATNYYNDLGDVDPNGVFEILLVKA
jgi:hypothetical protein